MQLIVIFSLDLYMARTRISFEEIYYILVKVPHQVVLFWVQIHLMSPSPMAIYFLYFTVMISIEFLSSDHAYCLHSSNPDSFIHLDLSQVMTIGY